MSEVNFTALPVDLTQSHESSYIVRISTNVISRAIYAPKIVFVYMVRVFRVHMIRTFCSSPPSFPL